jgi:hypothetical protein
VTPKNPISVTLIVQQKFYISTIKKPPLNSQKSTHPSPLNSIVINHLKINLNPKITVHATVHSPEQPLKVRSRTALKAVLHLEGNAINIISQIM